MLPSDLVDSDIHSLNKEWSLESFLYVVDLKGLTDKPVDPIEFDVLIYVTYD